MSVIPRIDWSTFDGDPPDELTCACGRVWFSHYQGIRVNDSYIRVARVACPACGMRAAVTHASVDGELVVVARGDAGGT